MKTKLLILFALGCAVAVQAGPRQSANYSIATDTADNGGSRTASASYTHDGSAGKIPLNPRKKQL